MDVITHLATGFGVVFTPVNLLVLVIGLVLGMLVAVLPGLTLVMGVVVFYGVLIIAFNFFVYIAYAWLDPKVKYR